MITAYEVTVTSAAALNNAAYVNLWAAGTRRLKVRELQIFQTSAATVAAQVQLVRTTARGTQSTTVTPTAAANAQDANDVAPTAVVDTSWSVQPTFAAVPMRQVDVPAAIGAGVIWSWPQDGELVVGNGAGLALENVSGSTGPALRVVIVWGE